MKRKNIIFISVLVVLQLCCSSLWALPTTAYEAEMAVAGWLKVDPQPLETALGREVIRVETFTDEYGEPVYYIVYLEPSGFVIVSADDLVEPIIGFADDGIYDPSPENPLGALVTNDLNGRMAAVHRTFRLQAIVADAPFSDTQKKWSFFISLAETSEDGFSLMGRSSIPDVRVAPMVRSKWGQRQACDMDTYNYYTPNNYRSGCVATAMAQMMRHYQHPYEPDDSVPNSIFGRRSFTIKVDGNDERRYLRGGNGNGGPYKWDQMVLEPGCSVTLTQRQAIGALCYDAGVSVNMNYKTEGSFANTSKARDALQDTFQYDNAIRGCNYDYSANAFLNIGSGLEGMVNPNLDAGIPVIFAIRREGGGHAILADGYGYNSSTPYHHLNMGWSGSDDLWYNLPNIDSTNYTYDVVDECIYNIFTSGSGEIISGRVTDAYGSPISGAKVTATGPGRKDTYTNSKGIYALAKVNSQSTYTLSVTKKGYEFTSQDVRTGKSKNSDPVSGNRWGVNFKAGPLNGPVEDFETNNFRKFPWEHEEDSHWTTTSWEKHSGNYSAQAGMIDDYGRTTLRVRLDDCISGNITFYRKVSSEELSDYLKFYIDGVEKGKWSGHEDWAEVSFHVTAGTRTFKWTYSKDYSIAEGEDTVWIDDIAFPVPAETPPTPPDQPTSKPASYTQCPLVETNCSLLVTGCSLSDTQCPPVNTQCPVESTKCPANLTSCPPQSTLCGLGTNTQCPPLTTECPPEETECPPEETECPPEETECPAAATRCPVESTKCPIDVTFCPRLPTMCVFFDTECPLVTFCPASDTWCPPVSTRCPVRNTMCVDTLCPSVPTRCPRIWPCNSDGTGNSVGEMRYSWSVGPCPAIEVPCPSVVPRHMLTETRQPVVQNIAPKTELED